MTPALATVGAHLDRGGSRHLYRQVTDLLREQIRSGALKPGDPVPPQRQLSAAWNISEMTVRRAMQTLAGEGLLEARAGGGTAICDRRAGARLDAAAPRRLSLGVAFANLADGYPFFPPVLKGLRAGPERVAVRLFDLPADADAAQHPPPLDDLDGLIMMSPVNLALVALCQRRRLPIVLLFTDLYDGYSHCIVPDYGGALGQAVRHLVQQGRRRIALVTAGAERFSTGRWRDGYRAALQMHDLAEAGDLIVHAGYGERDGYEATKQLLAVTPRPDAVLFASDFMARGGLLAAMEAGLDVPNDLAVVGAGNVLDRSGWPVPLTTIDLGLETMGRLAREAVAAAGTDHAPPLRQSLPTRLIAGSTG
ncbi:MAG: GntR family transcriptional regulator [Phycisphaeraceae bacterium]